MHEHTHTHILTYVRTYTRTVVFAVAGAGGAVLQGGWTAFFLFFVFFLPILLSFTLAGATRFVGVVNYVKQEINAHLHAKNKTNEVKNGKYRKSV